MRILYYSTAYHSGHGGSTHSRAFVQKAAEHPLVEEIRVFPPKAAGNGNPTSAGSLRSVLRSIPLMQIPFFYRRNTFHLESLCREIESWKPSHLVIRLDSNLIQVGKIRKRFPNLIVATEVNASPFDESFRNIAFKAIFRKKEKQWMKKSHHNFFVSGVLRESIMGKQLDPARDHVVHNGFHPERFVRQDPSKIRQAYTLGKEDLIIGYAGTLDRHKRVDSLIEAFSRVKDRSPRVRLIIMGDGPATSELKKLVDSLNLNKEVNFTGWIRHDQMPEYLSVLDIAVHHCALNYMSPLKLFEYAGMGIPTVGPDTKAVREVFHQGKHMLLTKETPGAIAAQLDKLINDRRLRENMGRAASEHVHQQYTWKHNVDRIIGWLTDKP